MDVLVNKMKPLTAKGSGNWFIDEVNAAVAQGKACIAFNWIAASGGLLDPKQSTLGTTREQILDKLGFATLPTPEDEPGARSAAWGCTSRPTPPRRTRPRP